MSFSFEQNWMDTNENFLFACLICWAPSALPFINTAFLQRSAQGCTWLHVNPEAMSSGRLLETWEVP